MPAQKLVNPPGERSTNRRSGTVVPRERRDEFLGELGSLQRCAERGDDLRDALVEHQRADRA